MSPNTAQALSEPTIVDVTLIEITDLPESAPPLPPDAGQANPRRLTDLELLRVEQLTLDHNYRRSFDPLWFLRSGWHHWLPGIVSWAVILSWAGRARQALEPLFGRAMALGRDLLHRIRELGGDLLHRVRKIGRGLRFRARGLVGSLLYRARALSLSVSERKRPPSKPREQAKGPITERIRIRPPSKADCQAIEQMVQYLDSVRGHLEEKSESRPAAVPCPLLGLKDSGSQLMVAETEGEVVGFVLKRWSP